MARAIKCYCVARWRSNFLFRSTCSRCLLLFISLKTPKLGVPTPTHPTHVGTPNLGVLYQSTQPCRDTQFGCPIPIHPSPLFLPSFPSQSEKRTRKTPKLGISTPIRPNHPGTPNLGILYQSPNPLSLFFISPPPSFPPHPPPSFPQYLSGNPVCVSRISNRHNSLALPWIPA